MSPRKVQRRNDRHRFADPRGPASPSTDAIVAGLVNCVAVSIGSVYVLTGSLLVTVIVGVVAMVVVGMVLGLRH